MARITRSGEEVALGKGCQYNMLMFQGELFLLKAVQRSSCCLSLQTRFASLLQPAAPSSSSLRGSPPPFVQRMKDSDRCQ